MENAENGTAEKKLRKGTGAAGSHSALFGLGKEAAPVTNGDTKEVQAAPGITEADKGVAPDAAASPPVSGTKVDAKTLDKMPEKDREATEKKMVDFDGSNRGRPGSKAAAKAAGDLNREVSPRTHDPAGVCTGDDNDSRRNVYTPPGTVKNLKNKLHF